MHRQQVCIADRRRHKMFVSSSEADEVVVELLEEENRPPPIPALQKHVYPVSSAALAKSVSRSSSLSSPAIP